MKKSLLFAGAIFLTSGIAIAKTIDFDTPIKWNTNVIDRALNAAGLHSMKYEETGHNALDARITHDRILAELLKKESFSVRDATRVCMDKCLMSDALKQNGNLVFRNCSEICSKFADSLITENNKLAEQNIDYNPNTNELVSVEGSIAKVFSKDKRFYALWHYKTKADGSAKYIHEKIKPYISLCDYPSGKNPIGVVFIADTDEPYALLVGQSFDGSEFRITNLCQKYPERTTYQFVLNGRIEYDPELFAGVAGITINDYIKINSMALEYIIQSPINLQK